MARRNVAAATPLLFALAVAAAPGCGGTLEGKYRRGEITTTTTTTTAARSPGTTGPGATTSSTATTATSGNAAGHGAG